MGVGPGHLECIFLCYFPLFPFPLFILLAKSGEKGKGKSH